MILRSAPQQQSNSASKSPMFLSSAQETGDTTKGSGMQSTRTKSIWNAPNTGRRWWSHKLFWSKRGLVIQYFVVVRTGLPLAKNLVLHKIRRLTILVLAAWPDMATELQRVKNPRGNWKVCAPSSELETLETKHAQHLNQIAGHPMRRENQKSLRNMRFFECLQQLIYLASGKCRRACTSAHPRSYKSIQNESKSSQKA